MTTKNRYIITIIAFSLLLFFYTNIYRNSSKKINYDYSIKTEEGVPIMVVRVIDGDTIELINEEHLRYIGMDTPEEFDPRKPVQCYAKEAATKNRQLVEGKMITFFKDVATYDKYGRWLGFVYLEDGTFVNLELVKEGYAFAYPYSPDISRKKEFKAAEKEAEENHLGLWSNCEITANKSGRKQTNAISN